MVAEAKRGYIYEFSNGNVASNKYMLVVANKYRAHDRMISIILLGDSNTGHDVVPINLREIGQKYLHCGMLSYVKREFLIKEVCKVPDDIMQRVEDTICRELDLREDIKVERDFYKQAYEDIINRTV